MASAQQFDAEPDEALKVPKTDVSSDAEKSSSDEVYVPKDDEEFIDPRLKDYPIPLVAKTVDLHNDPTEPILTFRFWVLSTVWTIVGCSISTVYYFKPYAQTLSSYAIQLLAWGTGEIMAHYLPTRQFTTFGYRWTMNPGKWNKKEHALIIVAYWGSSYTAYGLGPLSALQIYYGKKISAGWSILFLMTTQLIGYGFAGAFRDILVRPPKIYYPGVLPNVALFNTMHKNPAVTRTSLKFFTIVAVGAFIWAWVPELIFPALASLPIICWFGHGNPVAYVLGSGTYGFGFLTLSLDWNYINNSVMEYPWYTPLWAYMTMCAGVVFSSWLLYPILYYTNTLNAQTWPAMASGTYDQHGAIYNITRIMTPDFRLNQTAMDSYSKPYWSVPYVFTFFWASACSTGAIIYAILWYGKLIWKAAKGSLKKRTELDDYNDPYLKLMSFDPRVPHWWYLALVVVCAAASLGVIYGADLQLPWWGFILMALVSWLFTLPNGILWGVANQQIGMAYLSEVLAGSLFPGDPQAVLISMTYARQILEQNLNLVSDYKLGFYMKIPEKEMFIGQVWGTLLGPFINVCFMRFVIDDIGIPKLTGQIPTVNWLAANTKNFYSLSVLWGVLGPKAFFGEDSPYHWVYYGFLLGPAAIIAVWLVQKTQWARDWDLETYCNPTLFFLGASSFPIFPMTNFFPSFLASIITMGFVYRCYPAWWRKYHYLTGTGMDCGTQLMQTALAFCISLPNIAFPEWWGNQATYIDRCFPPNSKLPPAMQMIPSSR